LLSEASEEERSYVAECKEKIMSIVAEYSETGDMVIAIINLELICK